MVTANLIDECGIITLRPNRSASWQQTKLFVVIAGSVSLLIAAFWAVFGVWMILPFAGLEVGLLAVLMYTVSRKTYQQQVIRLGRQTIKIELGVYFPKRRWRFARVDTFVSVNQLIHPMDVLTIYMCSHQDKVEIGLFLNQSEKSELLALLTSAGLVKKQVANDTQAKLHA